jgi:CheY-like chemotaxis protein
MNAARPSKSDHVHLSDATAPLLGAIRKAQGTVGTARDLLARTHPAMETTRQLINNKKEILQDNQAILLLSESPAEIARFRYALEASALPCQLKFLMDRSEVEAFVRQAATRAPLFLPQLILTECQLPGMEAEEIVAAVRAAPAYHGIPLLLFSALEAAEGQRRCRQYGATAFVRKPTTWQAFVSAVASMVQGWGGGGDSQPPAPDQEEKGAEKNGFSTRSL